MDQEEDGDLFKKKEEDGDPLHWDSDS